MEKVRNIAMATYETLTEKQKEQVLKLFKSIDRDGDGKIVLIEFFHFFETNPQTNFSGGSPSWLLKLFQALDKDGDNTLDFTEFITFFYSLYCGVCCAQCQVILNGTTYFTCAQCFHKKPSFDLCRSCHSRKDFTHTHQDGTVPVFKDTASLHSREVSSSTDGNALKLVKNVATTYNAANLAYRVLPDDVKDKAHDIAHDVGNEIVDKVNDFAYEVYGIAQNVNASDVFDTICSFM